MPPHYVNPYVKRGKNDASDAAAICEAVTRPTRLQMSYGGQAMRFVSVKGMEQQRVLMGHRTRELLVRQRTMLINAIRDHTLKAQKVAPPVRLASRGVSYHAKSNTASPDGDRLHSCCISQVE